LSLRTHIAGIIPVANLETEHQTAISPILLQVDSGFTAIQKSVFECALAGCKTIWIVANPDLAPIVRKVMGDYVQDPVYYNRNMSKFHSELRREIPIYYVPISLQDCDKRDSYGWSVIHGVNSAWWVGVKISKWLTPDKYFVSFPMAAYDIYSLREYRKQIADKKSNFFLTYNNQTVKDNQPLSFTLTGNDCIKCRRQINKTTTREYLPPLEGEKYPSQKLPLDQRWSARKFDLSQVFDALDTKSATKIKLDWFYDLSSWQEYRNFLGSEHQIEKPYKPLTGPYTCAKLGE
jgi:hypothetical protein